MGIWSRGRRNGSGSKLLKFCEISNKITANNCFHYRATHNTAWSQKRTDPSTKKIVDM